MLIVVTFIVVLLGPIAILLFGRIVMHIDTRIGLYQMRFAGIVNVSYEPVGMSVEMGVGRLKRRILLQRSNDERRPKQTPKPYRKMRILSMKKASNVMQVIKTFKIKELDVMVDTGDMPLNGVLFPWFYLAGMRCGKRVMINFNDDNWFVLRIENTITRMLWAYIKS